jgi:serine/threonine protein kinase
MYCRADIIKAKPMWKPLPGSKYRQVFEFSDWVIKDVTREHKVTSREDFWKTGGTAVVTEEYEVGLKINELKCSHFVKTIDFFERKNKYYLVLERVGGVVLHEIKDLKSVVNIITEALYVLNELRLKGFHFCHGDLNNRNITCYKRDSPLEIIFHTDEGPVKFKSQYDIKFIDFGWSSIGNEGYTKNTQNVKYSKLADMLSLCGIIKNLCEEIHRESYPYIRGLIRDVLKFIEVSEWKGIKYNFNNYLYKHIFDILVSGLQKIN